MQQQKQLHKEFRTTAQPPSLTGYSSEEISMLVTQIFTTESAREIERFSHAKQRWERGRPFRRNAFVVFFGLATILVIAIAILMYQDATGRDLDITLKMLVLASIAWGLASLGRWLDEKFKYAAFISPRPRQRWLNIRDSLSVFLKSQPETFTLTEQIQIARAATELQVDETLFFAQLAHKLPYLTQSELQELSADDTANLLAILDTPTADPSLLVAILLALGSLPSVLPPAQRLTKHPDPRVRLAAEDCLHTAEPH